VLSRDDAYRLRAAAVDAFQMIVDYVRSGDVSPEWVKGIRLPGLDGWIWSIAKEREDLRRLPRVAEKNTLFY